MSRSKIIRGTINTLTNKHSNLSGSYASTRLDVNAILGRRVTNLSKNRFKFISSKSVQTKKLNERLARNRFKLVNRVRHPLSASFVVSKNGKALKRLGPFTATVKKYKLNTKFKLIKSSSMSRVSSNRATGLINNRYKLENRPDTSKLNKILIARFIFSYLKHKISLLFNL